MSSFIRCLNTQVAIKEVSRITADKLKKKVDNFIKRKYEKGPEADIGELQAYGYAVRENKDHFFVSKSAGKKQATQADLEAAGFVIQKETKSGFQVSKNKFGRAVTQEDIDEFKFQVLRENRNAYLAAKKQAILTEKIKDNPQQGLRALLDKDYTGTFKYDKDVPHDVWTLTKVYQGNNLAPLLEAIEYYRSKIPGGWDLNAKTRIADVEDLVRALFGKKTNREEIDGFAEAFNKVERNIVKDKQLKGAIVEYNVDRKVLSFNSDQIRAQGEQAFVDRMYNNLDLEKVYPNKTKSEIRTSLSDTYKRIITNGAVDAAKEGKAAIKTSIKGGRNDIRFVYKSPEAYLDTYYNYSNGDIFESMVKDIIEQSREQALMRVFGPKYEQTFKVLNTLEKAQLGLDTKALSKAQSASNFFASNEAIFRTLTGNLEGRQSKTLGNTVAAVRYLTMAKSLGSAALTSVTDHAVTKQMSKVAGVSFGRIEKNYLKLLAPKTLAPEMYETARKQAANISAVIDGTLSGNTGAARMGEEVLNAKMAKRGRNAADAVFRITGLTRHTQALKNALEISYEAEYGLLTNLNYSELPKANRAWLESNGITEKMWETVKTVSKNGEIDLNTLFSTDQRLFEQWVGARVSFVRSSVPEPSALVQTAMGANYAAGTFPREMKAALLGLQSYNLSLVHVQAQIAANNILLATKSSKIGQITAVAAYSAIMTGLSLQLKAVSSGQDFYDPTDPKYWGTAFLMTMPYVGDILPKLFKSKDSGDVAKAMMGPYLAAGFTTLVKMKVAAETGFQYAILDSIPKSKWESAMYAVFDDLATYVPGSNTWMTKLAVDRLIKDQIQKVADPKAYNAFSKEEQRLREQSDREFYWAPGEVAPSRAPRALTH